MRILNHEGYRIELVSTVDASVYNNNYVQEYGTHNQVGIKISLSEDIVSSAIIGASGGSSGIFDNSFIAKSDRVLITSGDSIFSLSIPDLTLEWCTICDSSTCFQIFPYHEDYIVHGEMEITRLKSDGSIVWQQSGADIFVTLEGRPDDFIITEDFIKVKDFDYRVYKFDFNGNILA